MQALFQGYFCFIFSFICGHSLTNVHYRRSQYKRVHTRPGRQGVQNSRNINRLKQEQL